MDQLTVFTTVLGYTDPLHEPPSNSKARFICFTDCDIQSKGWQLVKIEPQKAPKRLSKQIKALSHLYLHTEWSLWIDCCFDCLVPPESLVGYGEFVTFKHKDRSNVYDESTPRDLVWSLERQNGVRLGLRSQPYATRCRGG